MPVDANIDFAVINDAEGMPFGWLDNGSKVVTPSSPGTTETCHPVRRTCRRSSGAGLGEDRQVDEIVVDMAVQLRPKDVGIVRTSAERNHRGHLISQRGEDLHHTEAG